MNIPYGSFMGFLTHAPGDWDSSVKDEPLSPDGCHDFRLHQSACQRSMTSPGMHFNLRERALARQGAEVPFSPSSTEKLPFQNKTEPIETVLEDKVDKLMSFNPCQFLGMSLQEQQEMARIIDAPKNNNEFPMNQLMFRPPPFENGFSDDSMVRDESHNYNREMQLCFPQMFMAANPTAPNPALTFQPPTEPFFFGTAVHDLKLSTAANELRKRNIAMLENRFQQLSQTVQAQRATPTPKSRRPRIKHSRKYGHILWKFILELLMNPNHRHVIRWTGKKLNFKIFDKIQLSRLWSQAKVRQNNVKISYESITRALRSYKPKPKETGKPAIISHSMDSNFTYFFNEFYRKEIAEEVKLSFDDLLTYAKCAAGVDFK